MGGRTVSVSQVSGCSYTVSPTSWPVGSGTGSKKITISTTSACSWTVKPSVSWITASVTSGKANGSTTLSVVANAGTSRTATVNVAGKTVTVSQAGKTVAAPVAAPSTSLRQASASLLPGPGASSSDADADGLPDDWETLVGLRTDSAAGDDGAAGDPDGDGVDNATEFANGTHPRGDARYTRYLGSADGAETATDVAVVNPGANSAHVWIRASVGGAAQTVGAVVEPRARTTVSLPGVAGPGAGTAIVESDAPIVVERAASVTAGGAVAPPASASPASTHWVFAAGTTHGSYDVVLRLRNDTTMPADVRVAYLAESAVPIERSYDVEPGAALEVVVGEMVEPDGSTRLADTDVAMTIDSTNGVPVFAERVLVETQANGLTVEVSRPAPGAPAASSEWYFAELPTGTFDQFLTIANTESTSDAQVEATYTVGGRRYSRAFVLAPAARQTIAVDAEAFGPSSATPLANGSIAIAVASTNGVPVVAERAIQWTSGAAMTGVSSVGVEAGTTWVVADGAVDGQADRACRLFVTNVVAVGGSLRVTVLPEQGAESSTTLALPANGRVAVDVARTFGIAQGQRFGLLVESVGTTPAPVVVEHDAFDPAAVSQPAPTRVMATRIR